MLKTNLLFFLGLSLSLWGQEVPAAHPAKDLARVGRQILEAQEFAVRDSANQRFLGLLEQYATTPEGFKDELPGVTNMMRLSPKKNKFCLYTWQMPDANYQYQRFGLVVVKTKKSYVATRLQDQLKTLDQPEFKRYQANEWPGAIYYKLLPEGQKRNLYTLLGFAMGEKVHQKIVEVIEVKDNGRVRFGAKIFKVDQYLDKTLRRPPMRLIFKYNADYSVTINWHAEEEKIIMDHLAPPDPKLKGLYQTYGPDFTYDALYWEDNWWHLQERVKFNTGQNNPIVPPKKPTGLPPKKTPPASRNN
jgi:hypothetical protein